MFDGRWARLSSGAASESGPGRGFNFPWLAMIRHALQKEQVFHTRLMEHRIRQSLRLQLLPTALAAIVITTMIPVELRRPSFRFLDVGVHGPDILFNVLLYFPLGVAMGGTGLVRCFLSGFLLSLGAEILQFGCANRSPSPIDLVSNTTGTLLGFWFVKLLGPFLRWNGKSVAIPKPMAWLAIPLALLGVIILVAHKEKADFSNWDNSFQLAIGDELSGGRPWQGMVSQLAIYPVALKSSLLERIAGQETAAITPIFQWKPQDVERISSSRVLLNREQAQLFFKTITSQNQLSVLVWMRPANVTQGGPARIVTYSQDAFSRNFTLGQAGRTLNFRLRTPTTGWNGTAPDVSTGPVLPAEQNVFAAAVYDGAISRIYVDGRLRGQANLGARRPRLPRKVLRRLPPDLPIRDLETNIGEFCIGWLLGLGVAGLQFRTQSLKTRWLWGILAGAVAGAFIWALAVSEPLLGLRITAVCVAGAVIAIGSLKFAGNVKEADNAVTHSS